jgi:N-acyl-D-aspartate/D-glutamate deacylase
MPDYDLVIRNGDVIDGTGLPAYRADVGVIGGRIAFIGKVRGVGRREIDAEGHVVSPGFVDGHTHLDAQVCWEGLGSSSCYHGVTTVVMGNCGITLAPVRTDQRELLIRNLEGVEDIPAEALGELPWTWEHFREYLDFVDRAPKGINYAGYLGHSALRTWAMGERALTDAATDDDVALMSQELSDGLAAGALGFTTSRNDGHVMSDGRAIASRAARWDEVVRLVHAMSASGGGIFELANETVLSSPDPEVRAEYTGRLADLAVESGVPITFGVTAYGGPDRWRELLGVLDTTARRGGRMFGQSLPMEMSAFYSFKTRLPFDDIPVWRDLRSRPFAEQLTALRDPSTRERLVHAALTDPYAGDDPATFTPNYERLFVLRETVGPNRSVAELAQARHTDPVSTMIDLALETDFGQFFTRVAGNADGDDVRAIASHPRTVMTFTDSGAHVGQFTFASMHTHVLSDWVRRRQVLELEEAIRRMTLVPATAWQFADRGLIREGFLADINVFDPATVAPALPTAEHDQPGGVVRIVQKAQGFKATIVAGTVLLADGEHTGAYPGRLVRRGVR